MPGSCSHLEIGIDSILHTCRPLRCCICVISFQIVSQCEVIVDIEMKIAQWNIELVGNAIRFWSERELSDQINSMLQVVNGCIKIAYGDQTMSAMTIEFRCARMNMDATGKHHDGFAISMEIA